MGKIVVGIDGSEQAQHALDWALEEAVLRGAEVVAVHAHLPDTIDMYGMDGIVDAKRLQTYTDEFERQHQQVVDDQIAGAGEKAEDVPITTAIERGWSPAHAIVEHSKGAELVVVGSRGRGGFSGVLLGSVSQQVAHHAHCPVVIVGPPR